MTKLALAPPKIRTVADLIKRLGDIPPSRIRMDPLPGSATEEDILRIDAREDRLCEVVQGVLIEKTLGYVESRVAAVLAYFLERFRDQSDLGDSLWRKWPGSFDARPCSHSRCLVRLVEEIARSRATR